jgi:superfamily I DNA and/or RNA helicase
MIIANRRNVTADVVSCQYNSFKRKYDIKFKTGDVYSYRCKNVIWLKDPKVLNPSNFRVVHENKELLGISEIFVFGDRHCQYWHICFKSGREQDYELSRLKILTSALDDKVSRKVFNYLKQITAVVGIYVEDGINLLSEQYKKIDFVSEDKAFSNYTNPNRYPVKQLGLSTPIFPFGCNASQVAAVKNALESQFSIVHGPPGTGKTLTILNIVANLLIAGKTAQVVSSNNSAIKNIFDKLYSYDLDFIVAFLGNSENRVNFIRNQKNKYPDTIESWGSGILDKKDFLQKVRSRSEELSGIFNKQERLALAKHNLHELEVEFQYFKEYLGETIRGSSSDKTRKNLKSDKVLRLWRECQRFSESQKGPSFFFKCKCRFIYGISVWSFYDKDNSKLIALMQKLFYDTKRVELICEIKNIEKSLAVCNHDKMVNDLSEMSMQYLKALLKERYGKKPHRMVFSEEDLWKNPTDVQDEYPIILSTTFSSRSSLCKNAEFDYIIIDEASQVDVTTGALALSCAKNAVIVGDAKQLPNVVPGDIKPTLQAIFDSSDISRSYDYTEKSFLQSVCDVMPNIPRTLLREHYRCHPKIINFCNQKFYGGNLLIMTKDNGEKSVITVVKTVVGNHERDRINQRQIDVIKQELLPTLPYLDEEIGIIAPYNNQVNAIHDILFDRRIDIATVHKFQGREKNAIIITTVDNKVNDFSDNPYLLNVAISRAKKSLYLVVSGNEQPKDSNIRDFIDYIEYNNFTVTKSSIYSIFDFLYRHYTESRIKHLKQYRHVSRYDSENLMYALISDVLHENNFSTLGVACQKPLNELIRDFGLLSHEERRYATNSGTHLDFLIYNRFSKKPLIAIEVDGFDNHKEGTEQALRDKKKNRILELYGIPLLRFGTNCSGEKERIISKLREVLDLTRGK